MTTTKTLLAFSLFTAAGLAGCTAPGQIGAQNEALGSTSIVVSQVYVSGGNGSAANPPAYTTDYVVVFNKSAAAVNLADYGVYYHGSGSTATWAGGTALALTGTLAPGKSWLVQATAGSGSFGAALPEADSSEPTLSFSSTSGSVAVAAPGLGQPTTFVDLVGWGTPFTGLEEGTKVAAPSNANALFRAGAGCTDTDNNATDFASATAAPINSTGTAAPCSSTPATDGATAPTDMAQSSTTDSSTSPGDGAIEPTGDGSVAPHDAGGATTHDGSTGGINDSGEPVGNQPQDNGSPTYKPGGTISSDCSVGGFGGPGHAGSSTLAAMALAGMAMLFRRRRAS